MPNIVATTEPQRPTPPSFLSDRIIAVCVGFVALGAGIFGYWSATAPLAQGVTAVGTLIVEDRRRTIQHREGGIIESLYISEGDAISSGELAMVISDADAKALFSRASSQRVRLLAELDRYDSQLSNSAEVNYTRLAAEEVESAQRDIIISLNNSLFADQRAAQEGEKMLVNAQIDRLRTEAEALNVLRRGKRREIDALTEELDIQEQAVSQRLGNISRVNELTRLLAIAETELAGLDEQEQVILKSIHEAQIELTQIDLRFRARISEDRTKAFGDLASVTEELTALQDQQNRSAVIAPIDGVVIDLAFTAEGGVVTPGETVFDIVPSEARLQVEVRFNPNDRDDLAEGRDVNLRFGSLDPINPPEITGTLENIAADASFDEQTGTYYYLSKVAVTQEELDELADYKISPGIPVEVFFDKGSPRTPLSYLIEPISEMFRLGMRS